MSAKDQIITLPNPHLHSRSKKVGLITPEILKVISIMKSATLDWESSRKHELGVALAAIQIDQPLRLVIVRNNFEDKKDKSFNIFINPEIVKLEGEIELDYEGCLSVSDIYGKVPRYTKVRVRALDENGRTVRVKAEGFLARVFQHEIDHTNGLVFVDHLKDSKDSFYKLNPDGALVRISYDEVKKTNILR